MYKVLVADDEPFVIEGLDIMIDWTGHEFEITDRVCSGTEALERLEKSSPDLIVVDINMPGMNGLELVEKAVSGGYKGEIIILTGYAEVDYARRAMSCGVKYFINKPVDEDEFHDALKSVKESLDAKKKLKGMIDRNEAIAAAQRKNILNGNDPEHIAGGFMILDIGSGDISETLFPKGVYVYGRYSGMISLIISIAGDFEKITEELFAKVKESRPEVVGVRLQMCENSIEKCNETAIKSLMCMVHREKGTLYDAKKNGDKKISPIEIADYADRVMSRTELCDMAGADTETEKLFMLFENSTDPLAYAMIFASYLLVRINKLMIENGGNSYNAAKNRVNLNTMRSLWLDQYYEMVKNMCYTAIEHLNKRRLETDGHSFNIVEKYIKEHFREQIVIQDMAKKLYTSPGYLGTVFTKRMGVSIKEYLHTLRMEEAVRLMTETDMSLSEIAYDVGYNNYNNFYNHFERIFGMTPREYKDAL